MTNAELIQKIRAEIIGRIDKRHLSTQARNELVSLLSFLDTLEEQDVKEQKSQDTVGRVSVEIRSNLQTDEVVRKTLIMLVNDGRISVTGAITSSDILDWLEGQKEPEMKPDELNKAAIKYCPDDAYPFGPMAINLEVRKAFIAGAKWQKQHDAELIEIAYNDGITIGMTKQKKQMMEEAVECELYYDGDFLAIDLNMAELGYSERDKVRIIVLKNTEK